MGNPFEIPSRKRDALGVFAGSDLLRFGLRSG